MRWLISAFAVCLLAACTNAENSYDLASPAVSLIDLTPQSEPWLVSDTLYLPPGPALKTMTTPVAK